MIETSDRHMTDDVILHQELAIHLKAQQRPMAYVME